MRAVGGVVGQQPVDWSRRSDRCSRIAAAPVVFVCERVPYVIQQTALAAPTL
jgi:hypothetical protein